MGILLANGGCGMLHRALGSTCEAAGGRNRAVMGRRNIAQLDSGPVAA